VRKSATNSASPAATPYLLLDPAHAVLNAELLRDALPGVDVHYAFKCNPDLALARALAAAGVGFEIASLGELEQLRSIEIAPSRLLCLHPVKSPAFVRALHAAGVEVLAFDSPMELEKIAVCAPGSHVAARLEVPNAGSRVPLAGKFGCSVEEAVVLFQQARKRGLKPAGITMHVGSQCESLATWEQALAICQSAVEWMRTIDSPPTLVSLGGGWPVDSALTVEAIGEILPDFGCRVTAEPGRFLAASAGTLVARVIGTAERDGVAWAYLDAGIHQGLFDWRPGSVKVEHLDRPRRRMQLAGPTCDSRDVIAVMELPELRVGDRVAFRNAGAYSSSLATSFNGFPPPQVIVLDEPRPLGSGVTRPQDVTP